MNTEYLDLFDIILNVVDYQVLLYYKYVLVDDPEALMQAQRQVGGDLGLKGRIIISAEGINGTVEGSLVATEGYIRNLRSYPDFSDIEFKRSAGTGQAFPKLSVKVRPDLVSAQIAGWGVDPGRQTGVYLPPDELHNWIESGQRFFIVDMRNDYEQVSGHFAGSVLPAMRYFRDLPKVLPTLDHLKDETIVTVCTGGIRCEKASAFLLKHGFRHVYQLQGGIVSYMERYPHQDFLGQLYVFDGRVVMGFQTEDRARVIVGRCALCKGACERYLNCANLDCHRHFLCCEACQDTPETTYCSAACRPVAAHC